MVIRRDDSLPRMSASSGVEPTVRLLDRALALAFFIESSDYSAVLRFNNVRGWHYGYPNDEGLDSHPLYGHGLELYAFHSTPAASHGERSWIATFHDGTFTIYADSVETLAKAFDGSPSEALDSVLGAGDNQLLDASSV